MAFQIEDGILIKYTAERGETSVTVPEGVTMIGDQAFANCRNLAVAKLPEGVTGIGQFAFAYCDDLSVIMLPESLKKIDSFAFSDCAKLDNVMLPEGLTFLGNGVFFKCSGLSRLEVPSTVTKLGSDTFYKCTSLKRVVLHEGLSQIGGNAFFTCDSLVHITLPRSLAHITLYDLMGPHTVEYYDTTEIKADSLPYSSTLLIERSAETGEVLHKLFFSSDNEPYKNHDMLIASMKSGHIDAEIFDSCFDRLEDTGNRCMMALFRLECPRDLSDEAKDAYETYLREHAAETVERLASVGAISAVRTMAGMGMFTSENIDECIGTAADAGIKNGSPLNAQINAFLMNYKNENFAAGGLESLELEL